jgi:hypothetical protein
VSEIFTDDITENRKRYIRALRHSKNQNVGQAFRRIGSKETCCAIGVGIRTFCGIKTAAQYAARIGDDGENDYWESVNHALGIPMSVGNDLYWGEPDGVLCLATLWRWNDIAHLSFSEIGDKLTEIWDL